MRLVNKARLAVAIAALLGVTVASGYSVRATMAQTESAKPQSTGVTYAPIPGGEYRIDPAHSVIGFAIRHLEIALVQGRFKDFSGVINYDNKDITKSSVSFSAKIESIDTGVQPRDAHLRTADFFDAAKYPEMTFKSTRVERKSDNSYVLHGDLTLKGTTKPVAIPFTMAGAVNDGRGNTRFGIEAHTKINRRDFGITYGSTLPNGGLDIGNEVSIVLHLEAMMPPKKSAQAN